MADSSDPLGDGLDLRVLGQGLARSGGWIAGCLLVGAAAGLATGLVRPNQYVSEGKIEVRLGIRESRKPESTLSTDGDRPMPTPGIGDELALLYNPEVYERIAREIGPERLLAPYDPAATDGPDTPLPKRWLHRLQSWWFGRGQGPVSPEDALREAAAVAHDAIEVSSLNGTSYLLVLSTATSPEMAQLLTRTYVHVARQWHREVYAFGTELTFVSDQLALFEEESASAVAAYAQHREQCGFYDLEEQKAGIVATLANHDELIQENTIRQIEVEDELAFVEQQLAMAPPTVEKLVPPSLTINPEYQSALDQLQKLNSERADLASVYTEDSGLFERRAVQLDAEIARVEARLAQFPQFIEFGVARREEIQNPRHEELTIRRDELRQEKGTRARTIELWQGAREEQRTRLRAALQCEPVHRDLALAEARAKARVQELSNALERAQALALLDRQEEMDSLRIALDGDLPRTKSGPRRGRFLLLGVFGGLAAGIFLATLRFLTDARLHDAEAFRRELELPILGLVPESRAWRRGGAARPSGNPKGGGS